jgi:hypothetical protein
MLTSLLLVVALAFVCADVDLAPNLFLAAANNVLLHLDKLMKEGKVRAIQDQPRADDAAPEEQPPADEDDCKAEVAKAHAIARQRATWRWQLTH